jgi:metallo-beta-lactamase family protein
MRITSYGAAEEVTGSKHLLEVNGKKILIDCGMFQGARDDSDRKNRSRPFPPTELDSVVLTHAHIDHCGLLPMLVKYGYGGPIYATPATRDLCAIMLLDSAKIQKGDAEWLSKKQQSFVAPLYDEEDVQTTMKRFISIPYEMRFEPVSGTGCMFHDAGHVLGSAMAMFELRTNGTLKRYLAGGDLGRKRMPILQDPWEPEEADVVMMESTYGNRDHEPYQEVEGKLSAIIHETHRRGGKIIVPSFSLERSQELIFCLKQLEMKGSVPAQTVFVDSPLTVNITDVFRLHTESFDTSFRKVMSEAGDPFQLEDIRYVRSHLESKKINDFEGPCIIISAAGMCEHGRILHHIRNNCENEKNTILIVGFQAKNTLGRRIVERQPEIKIFGVKRKLNADVKVMNAMSAHAGRSELIDFGKRFKNCAEKVLLVHGELEQMNALKSGLEGEGCKNIQIQKPGVPVEF